MNRLGEYAGGLELAYQNALAAQDPATAQQIDANMASGMSWVSSALKVAQSAILADSQRRLLNMQIERARNGQAPLDASQFGLGVNVGLSPQTLKMVGLALGGAALLYFLTRRGR
jgi:hypothetical protein